MCVKYTETTLSTTCTEKSTTSTSTCITTITSNGSTSTVTSVITTVQPQSSTTTEYSPAHPTSSIPPASTSLPVFVSGAGGKPNGAESAFAIAGAAAIYMFYWI
jgi:hypothetical protein